MNYKELLFNKDNVLTFYPELAVILNKYDKILAEKEYESGKKEKKRKAGTLGLNEAIIINQINYWCQLNEKSGKNCKDGYSWTYNTYEKWAEKDFPYWSADTIRKSIIDLEQKGIVVSTNEYNSYKIDNTKWYRVDCDKLQEIINIVTAEDERKEKEKKEKKEKANKSQKSDNETCDCVCESYIDGLGIYHKPIPENTNRDYTTDNTDINAFPDKSEKVEDIYAFFPEEKQVKSRYIPEDYTEEQLIEHIEPVIRKRISEQYDGEYNKEELSDTLIEIIRIFYNKYFNVLGKRHRILSDMAYENIADEFMYPPIIMSEESDKYDIPSYVKMMNVYFTTEYNKRKKYSKDIELSISHFMSENIRSNLYYRTRNLEE